MPILLDTGTVPVASSGCSTATICHNASSPIALDPLGTKHLAFTDASTTLAALMMDSVNAPGMARVAPGSVANSFMAYKLSGADGLACVNSKCTSGASVGTSKPCGDPMPTATTGVLSASQKTLILDWIALGASP